MADPASIDASFKRTYDLTVPVLDLAGDPPAVAGTTVTVQLVRADGQSQSPLFGPGGLLVGAQSIQVYAAAAAPSDETLLAETATFELIPNGYWFVPTVYILMVAGRTYQFTMPAEDSSIITLLDAEDSTGGTVPDGGTTPGVRAVELPTVASVADAAELANAQGTANRSPIFARVTADFATWETGDLLVWRGLTDGWALLVRTHTTTVRNRGLVLAWFGAAGIPAVASRQQTSILDSRPALALSRPASNMAMHLNVALPDSLADSVESIRVDGFLWFPDVFEKGATAVEGTVAYRLYRSDAVLDASDGIGPMNFEIVLRTAA